MYVSYDPKARATYVEIEDDARVTRTVHISDLVMVDVDVDAQPVGVEFVVGPNEITQGMVDSVIDRFPQLKTLNNMHSWLLVGA